MNESMDRDGWNGISSSSLTLNALAHVCRAGGVARDTQGENNIFRSSINKYKYRNKALASMAKLINITMQIFMT